MNSTARALFASLALSAALPVLAQAISVTTPRLPPRSNAPAASQAAATPATGQTGTYVAATAQPAAYPGTSAGAATQPGAYLSPTNQGNPYGAAASSYVAPGVAMVAPQRAPADTCRAQPTPDRQTLVLISGPDSLARVQVPLGEFRAQLVVHSPDGRWAVAFTKLRGAPQYAAMTIDLERCEVQRVVDLSSPGEEVRFEGDDALLQLSDGERRVALRDGRVR